MIKSMLDSMYTIHLDISDYNLMAINDFMRFFIIQLTPQLMFSITRSNFDLFNPIFIETTVYILLGVLLYWLVFNYFVVFTNKENADQNDYYQKIY